MRSTTLSELQQELLTPSACDRDVDRILRLKLHLESLADRFLYRFILRYLLESCPTALRMGPQCVGAGFQAILLRFG